MDKGTTIGGRERERERESSQMGSLSIVFQVEVVAILRCEEHLLP
jgi:hypothetical protein